MSGQRVLVVEDDQALAGMLQELLDDAGYVVEHAPDGQRGLHLGLTTRYDAFVLDRGLPAIDGLDLLHRLRGQGITTPALILSALGNPADVVEGLDAGAEDYVSKPFDIDVLLARLRALVRRSQDDVPVLRVPGGQLDTAARRVSRDDGTQIDLSPREGMLLEMLARHPSQVFERATILRAVFADADDEGSVDTYVHYLRRKLGRTVVRTVRGVGYGLGLGMSREGLSADDLRLRRAAWRLGSIASGLVLLTLLLVGATVLVLVARSEGAALRDDLRSTVEHTDDPRDAPPGVWTTFREPGGEVRQPADLPTGLPDVAAQAEATRTGSGVWSTVTSDDQTFTVYTAPVERDDGTAIVQAATDSRRSHEERERLVTALLVAGLVGVIAAGGLGAILGRRAVRPLVTALALQRRFVADASHELRTPLTLLTTRAQLARRHLSAHAEDVLERDLDGLLADAGALTGVLDELLLGVDPRTMERVPVDVGRIVADVVSAATAEAAQRGVHLTQESTDEPTTVKGSSAALRRAVTALVDNALDHARSEVSIDVRVAQRNLVVVVRDDGPGIPAGQEKQVFERFASRRPTTTTGPRHYGLGLALVAEVAHQHGGSVAAHPLRHGGSELSLTLPRS